MKISNSEIRAKAREALGSNIFERNWLMSIVAVLVVALISGFASSASCGIGTYLIVGPLSVGLSFAFLKLVRHESDMELGSAFSGFNNFGQNLVLGIMHNLLVLLWSLLFIIPGIIKSYAYSMVYFVKADHPEYGWRECLNESEKLMKGNKWRFFCLNFSFIGWMFLSVLTCGIGILWVNAYMQSASAVFYEEVKRENMYYGM